MEVRMTESSEYCDHLKATELTLGLPSWNEEEQPAAEKKNSSTNSKKRASPETKHDHEQDSKSSTSDNNSSVSDARNSADVPPPSKAQIVGWPPVRSYRKNIVQQSVNNTENNGKFVKVSMDGAAYLRKLDLKVYNSYSELLKALETMFKVTIGKYSEREGYINKNNGCPADFAPTYEDKDGDWMLVGDVPWGMFISSCKRLRVMKSSEAKGLGCF